MFSGILANQAPPKQTATATIATLCDRLAHATLLEDRRAAVLGLRSFARDYKESVASGGLRWLIVALDKDRDDVDTVKVVLETLLLLFANEHQNSDSPDDIALWLADEFTQKQANINLLIDLLDQTDFYDRLYALRILSAILKNRPERTRECIYTAPLGLERLVATLDDRREIIRNEGVQLLIALTDDHAEIQKLVAYNGAFDGVFNIIDLEGGITGGFLVQDCLRLLTNLLAFNVSNQSYFQEARCDTKLVQLLGNDKTDDMLLEATSKNLLQLLNLCKVFVTFVGSAAEAHQKYLWDCGLTPRVLALAFSPKSTIDVRAEALCTAADLIRGNHALQEKFALMQVDASTLPGFSVPDVPNEGPNRTAFVIEALLNMALLDINIASFNVRMAAVQCIEAYVHNNPETRLHFIDRAVKGFTSGEDETANIFNSLIELDSNSQSDPYKTWFSGAIFQTLIFENREAQDIAMNLTSGDAESGEEVVTAIQNFSSNLLEALQYGLNSRISLAFLMILCVWLNENPEAVNDFLMENSTLESLLALVNHINNEDAVLLQGVCTFLIGIVFEFSTKESPVPRVDLHSRILGRLKKDQYFLKLHKLRQHPAIRDFEEAGNRPHRKGLPEVYFTGDFIKFFKDNYSKNYYHFKERLDGSLSPLPGIISRSLDRDPGDQSGHHGNGEPHMVSEEMLQSVTAQLEIKEDEYSKLQAAHTALEHQLSQEQERFRSFKESSSSTVQKIKEVAAREIATAQDNAQAIQEESEANILAEREAARSEIQEVTLRMDAALRESRAATDKVTKETSVIIAKLQEHSAQLEKELGSLREGNSAQSQQLNAQAQQIDNMKSAILKLESQLNEQLDTAKKTQSRHESERDVERKARDVERKAAEKRLSDLKREMESRLQETARIAEDSAKKAATAEAEILKVKEAAKKEKAEMEMEREGEREKAAIAQAEADDLMLVMADLEENVKKYKARLKKLGEDVTDDEGEGEEEEEEEEEEED
ncbi:hypothetical protein H072_11159 [Dactylellina haptotyla CBS 200.50]|uniref:Vesicle tethering protein Uso1/P115-like head domain-containing protein n=1 Tax=Dactylellina haptotyla (strain CBS 200.50) TaxID=1284197 RepID=S8BJP5_DACHA|nr:hypothetical protein H072_11159 [Dactylellina haptotyla CBS 200.50]